jgi:hypothetical protein
LSLKLAVALLRAVTASNVRSVDQSMLNSQQVRSVDQREFNSHGTDAVLRSVDLASARFSSANRSAQSDHASLTARYPGFVADVAAA